MTLVSAGRADARVLRASFEWYSPAPGSNGGARKVSCELPADHLEDIDFPQLMPAHTEYSFSVRDLAGVDPGLWAALHENRQVRTIFHQPAGRAGATIKYRRS
jgi:hypothetical protein